MKKGCDPFSKKIKDNRKLPPKKKRKKKEKKKKELD